MILLHLERGELRVTSVGVKGRTNKRGLKRILIALVSGLAAFSLLATLSSALVFRMVFSRPTEENFFSPPAIDGEALELSFSSGEHRLRGRLYLSPAAAGLVLMVHGMHGEGADHNAEAQYFLDRGWSVFLFDGTAAGGSEGSSARGLQQMSRDLLAAIDFIETIPEAAELPLLLYGHSMGGYAAAIAAGERAKIAAVVSISGFDRPMGVVLDNGHRYVGVLADLGYPFVCLQNRLSFGDFCDRSAAEAINRSSADFYIVYGSEDPIISEAESIYGQQARITNPNVTYLLLDEPHRSSHSAAWFSSETAALRAGLEEDLKQLEESYPGGVPEEQLLALREKTDPELLWQLDDAFMDSIHEFFLQAIA